MYCWGAGHSGQLGDGEVLNISLPKKIEMDVSWRDVRCGDNCTFGLTGSSFI
jgi:alpha-tubulin suppressor-like RCC1 family protein